MRNTFLVILLIFSSMLGYTKSYPFLLSSTKISQENPGSLKGLHSFTFFPILRMEEKDVLKIIDLIDRELNKVALVVKKSLFSPEGFNFEGLSNPSLQFTIEQIVDQKDHPLPVLQAVLSASSVVELGKSKELASITTNRWYVYLEKINNVQKAVEKTLPCLLKQFIKDYQQANATEQKPTFYIIYESSLWKNQMQK